MTDNSILAVDFGNIHTRALLIDLVEGVYRLVAVAEENTTGGFPISDVGVGFHRAVEQLMRNTGRHILADDGRVITPEQQDRTGVDVFVATASIGRPLRTVLIGLMPDMSIASAQRAVTGTYVDVVAVISLDDEKTAEDHLNTIVLSRPDLIFIAGGTEGGAREPVLELARLARLALHLMGTSVNVLYAGNSDLIPQIRELLENVATVFFADNVRPALGGEMLSTAQMQLARAFDAFTERRGLGFDDISYMSRVGVVPTAQSYHTIIDYLGRTTENGGALAVDIGSAVSTLSASVHGVAATSIRTDIGVGHSARSLLDVSGLDAVRAWLPFYADDNEIIGYALNKTLRPITIPENERALLVEHALLRVALSELLLAARPTWTPDQALDDLRNPLPYFERIIGAGASLTGTGQPAMTAMLLLDALQPVGVVDLQSDPNAMIPALGALARINAEAVVQVLDASGLENLCTCINLSGVPRQGRAAVEVSVTSVESGETEKFTVQGGELWVYPLSLGVPARVRISVVGRGLSIDGKRRLRLDVNGGTAGLIIDARGRPLPLTHDLKVRALQIPAWYAQATGMPAFEIPSEWLVPPLATEQKITSVTDRRATQEDRVLSVLGDSESGQAVPARPPRGRLFGRGTREKAPVTAEAEGEEDDFRNLLS